MAKSLRHTSDEYVKPHRYARNTRAGCVLLAAVASLSIILLRPSDEPSTMSHAIPTATLLPIQAPNAETVLQTVKPSHGKYRTLGEYVARRYRVSSDVATHIVAKAHSAAADVKLDPLLILAVISIESRFNPIAESPYGAKGLMQIVPRYHPEKFGRYGGEKAAFEPEANILAGARILREYLHRTGDLSNALQMYVGASTENGYALKVLAERDRLSEVLRRYENRLALL